MEGLTLQELAEALKLGGKEIPEFPDNTTPTQLADGLKKLELTDNEIDKVAGALKLGVNDIKNKEQLIEKIKSTNEKNLNLFAIKGSLGLGTKNITTKDQLISAITALDNISKDRLMKASEDFKPWLEKVSGNTVEEKKSNLIQEIRNLNSVKQEHLTGINKDLHLGEGMHIIENDGTGIDKSELIQRINKLRKFHNQEELSTTDQGTINNLDEKNFKDFIKFLLTLSLLDDFDKSTKKLDEKLTEILGKTTDLKELSTEFQKIQQEYNDSLQKQINSILNSSDLKDMVQKGKGVSQNVTNVIPQLTRLHTFFEEILKEKIKNVLENNYESIITDTKAKFHTLEVRRKAISIMLDGKTTEQILEDYKTLSKQQETPEIKVQKEALEEVVMMEGLFPGQSYIHLTEEKKSNLIVQKYLELSNKPKTPQITLEKQMLEAMHARGRNNLIGPGSDLDKILDHPNALARVMTESQKADNAMLEEDQESKITPKIIKENCTLSVIAKAVKAEEAITQREQKQGTKIGDMLNKIANFFNKCIRRGVKHVADALKPLANKASQESSKSQTAQDLLNKLATHADQYLEQKNSRRNEAHTF